MESPDWRQSSPVREIPRLVLPAQTPRETAAALNWLLFAVFSLHMAMFIYDLAQPSVFLNADRSLSRLAAIQGLYGAWASGNTAGYLASHGIIGDYLFQALVIALAGKNGLIMIQVGLALGAGYAVFRLGQLLGLPGRLALLACAIYLLFPHSLLFPHQLAAESLYTPLLTIALWLVGEFVGRPRAGLLVSGGLLLGLATLIRPITLLWPLLVGVLLARACGRKYGAGYLALAVLPLVLWMSFIGAQTGSFSMGVSDHDLGHNLYQRVWRISETLPAPEVATARQSFLRQGNNGSLGVAEYLQFGLAYPGPFLKHALRDTLIFVGKSGIERIPIDYLQVNAEERSELQDSGSGWRTTLEQEGMMATLDLLWQRQGTVLLLSLAGSLLLLGMMAAALVGGWHLLSSLSTFTAARAFVAALLVCLPLYILLFSQVIDAVQSRHRAPAEAALVLLAVLGGAQIAKAFSRPALPPASPTEGAG